MKGIRPIVMFVLLLGSAPQAFADARERLTHLRAGFDDALGRLNQGFGELNQKYHLALTRQLEAESQAGQPDTALVVKREIEIFEAQTGFDQAAFERRLSTNDTLKRLQTTYLDQRKTLDQQLEPRRKELAMRFDQELAILQSELTRTGQLNDAVAVKTAQEQFRAEDRFARFFSDATSEVKKIRGKIHFVTKGELELYLNGKSLSYRNNYKGPDPALRITGETKGSEDFCAGDTLVIRGRSSIVFRGIILVIVSDDGTSGIPIRVEHLRYLGTGREIASLTADLIESTAPGGVNKGGNDPRMTQTWEELKLPPAEAADSEWFRSETTNEWHSWAIVLTPDMFVAMNGR